MILTHEQFENLHMDWKFDEKKNDIIYRRIIIAVINNAVIAITTTGVSMHAVVIKESVQYDFTFYSVSYQNVEELYEEGQQINLNDLQHKAVPFFDIKQALDSARPKLKTSELPIRIGFKGLASLDMGSFLIHDNEPNMPILLTAIPAYDKLMAGEIGGYASVLMPMV